ncbi:hypothetical protein [Quadrisphaera sp. DSM 44207]|uniref:hypothetical protein n=1 Tax=Quadrisphaera sp. DSM 44207 TaxID=1881057 RepID=UPI00088FD27F|nr:hypothetical protein [Quadrisphaera sp. DSM 44207]SDQ06761.1 hypothetical protein SAMN05428996_0323 [Quadrisphaera sp. DSM 44207]
MNQDTTGTTGTTGTSTATTDADRLAGRRRSGPGTRLPRRLAGGVVAVGALASCLTLGAQSAFAATGSAAATAPAAATAAATPTVEEAVAAFFDVGYTFTDAVNLAVLWGAPSVYDAKVAAGTEVLAGQPLPYGPGDFPPTWTTAQEVAAFSAVGGDHAQALKLAAVWGSPSVYDAKAFAGSKLLAGYGLPGIPEVFTTEQQVNAYLASGLDYEDGVQLAAIWGSPSVYDAKAFAGSKLLAGHGLPIQP